MRIGIHVQGFKARVPVGPANAAARGAETTQIFASNPRQWRLPEVDPGCDGEFRGELEAKGIGPLFLHAPYLVNLASPTKTTREMSERTVGWTMTRAQQLGAEAIVVHAGSSVGKPRPPAIRHQARAIIRTLGDAEGCRYLIEMTAGSVGAIASTFEQALDLLDACDGHEQVGFCIDTCHLHAAGYDLTSSEGVAAMAEEMDATVGTSRLGLIHANDSRDPRGSHRDRHWHIGQGYIGQEGFRALLSTAALAGAAVVCETPGKLEDDIMNVCALKALRGARNE